jgi:uncharacterized protein YidB (DUF937 family)
MKKNLKWLIGAVVAGLLVVAFTIPAFAAGPGGNSGSTTSAGQSQGYAGYQGLGIGYGLDEAVTELLGMTPEEIQAERLEGKSLVQIAADQGISEDELVNTILAVKKEALDQLVSEGTITQEQADLRLTQMEERITWPLTELKPGVRHGLEPAVADKTESVMVPVS